MTALHDFRSDTVTRPTPAMREAMARAEVGDDVLGDDPTVLRLQREVARLLGMEAALFVPSGTMANQIAVHVHCRPGDELICEERAHVCCFEGGSAARLSGVQVRALQCADGFPSVEQIERAIRPDDSHYARSRLLVIENTHNMAGGRVAGPARMRELADAAHARGLLVHVDGARLCNAAAAAGCAPAELVAHADSVSLCLSKGLGAPVGSLVAGNAAFVAAAHRVRKAFGGGMRQAGVLAAAALIGFDGWQERLRRDHALARTLAEGLAVVPGLRVDPTAIETNIVMVDLTIGTTAGLLGALRERSVLAASVGPQRVRFVTHGDVGEAGVQAALAAAVGWSGRS